MSSKKIWKGDLTWENDVTEFKFGYKGEKLIISGLNRNCVFRFTSDFGIFRLPEMFEIIILFYNQKSDALRNNFWKF